LADDLRRLSEETGVSEQELFINAIDEYLLENSYENEDGLEDTDYEPEPFDAIEAHRLAENYQYSLDDILEKILDIVKEEARMGAYQYCYTMASSVNEAGIIDRLEGLGFEVYRDFTEGDVTLSIIWTNPYE